MKPTIFIDGEHGTTGLEIRARLGGRQDIEVTTLAAADRRDGRLRADRLNAADIAILCLPDEAARQAVAMLEEGAATRVIDTSTAHRTDPDWIYGFCEMDGAQAGQIAAARLVANPGCYSTGAIALIRPLRLAGLLPADYPVTIGAVSGYTGGGRQLIARMRDDRHPDRIAANHFAYGLALDHKHVPEIRTYALIDRVPLFAPSVGRFARGTIVQAPLHLDLMNGAPRLADIHAALAEHYAGTPLVEVAAREETVSLTRIDAEELAGRDVMKIHVCGTPGGPHVNLVAVFDNLGKGAAGAAVQNMDLMLAG